MLHKTKRIYTGTYTVRDPHRGVTYRHRYVLGLRCDRGHAGNRRYAWDRGDAYATCVGCHTDVGVGALPRFGSRAEALAADRHFRARWPEDPPADILAGRRI